MAASTIEPQPDVKRNGKPAWDDPVIRDELANRYVGLQVMRFNGGTAIRDECSHLARHLSEVTREEAGARSRAPDSWRAGRSDRPAPGRDWRPGPARRCGRCRG